MIQVLIYEDNSELQEALKLLLESEGAFKVVGQNTNCCDVLKEMDRYHPDIIIMDVDLPMMSGIEGLKEIRKVNQQVKVLIFTMFGDEDLKEQSRVSGANGFLLKKTPPQKLLQYLKMMQEGKQVF